MIDLHRIRVLRVLDSCGTITASAEILHLTPSAVSQQIRLLSRDLGVDLLVREGRRVSLTPAARVLLRHADDLEQRWERAQAEIETHAECGHWHLRLCGFSSAVAAVLAPAAARLHQQDATAHIQIAEAETATCLEYLLADRADIAILVPSAAGPYRDDTRFDQEHLFDDPLDLLVSASHHLAGHTQIDLSLAADEDWILPDPQSTDQLALMTAACATAGFVPRTTHRVVEWSAVTELVADGLGVFLLPRLARIPRPDSVARIPLAGTQRPTRRIVACTRAGSRNRPHINRALETIRAHLPQAHEPWTR
jgi:DNA-binding transcriptional LysR family regulator